MKHFLLSAVAVAIVLGGIWAVTTKPRASEELRATERALTMNVLDMMRDAKQLPEAEASSLF